MNNEELFKRILNKVCIHFGYDVAHDLEYLFLVKEQEIEQLKEKNEKLKKFKNLFREKFISNFCANNRAIKCIKDFLCTEEYIKSDPEATANNYVELLNILKSETQENLYKYTPKKGFRLVGDEDVKD